MYFLRARDVLRSVCVCCCLANALESTPLNETHCHANTQRAALCIPQRIGGDRRAVGEFTCGFLCVSECCLANIFYAAPSQYLFMILVSLQLIFSEIQRFALLLMEPKFKNLLDVNKRQKAKNWFLKQFKISQSET
jgi:hypothetical protein